VLETGVETRGLAAVLLEVQHPQPVLALGQLVQTLTRAIGRTVVDHHQLPRHPDGVEGRAHALEERHDIVDLIVDRHHNRKSESIVVHVHQGTPPCHRHGW
jgi:hypothetical protein